MRGTRLIRKPFKGNIAYEWQTGALVLQYVYCRTARAHFPRFHFWLNPYWR